jgi:hypothetical protein
MKETKPHKWSQAIYYVLASIVVLVLILLVAERFFPLSLESSSKMGYLSSRLFSRLQDTPGRAPSNPAREKILLALNHEKTIGKSKIIYRGLEKNSAFNIDVVILELDPNSFYRYHIQIDDAEKGFRLAGQDFKLISARKSALQIWHLRK